MDVLLLFVMHERNVSTGRWCLRKEMHEFLCRRGLEIERCWLMTMMEE